MSSSPDDDIGSSSHHSLGGITMISRERVGTTSVSDLVSLGHIESRPGMHLIYAGWDCDFDRVEFDGDESELMTFVYVLRGTDCELHVVDA